MNRILGKTDYSVPVATLTYDPKTKYYGFSFRFEGRSLHHAIASFKTIDDAKTWADPWGERIWEEPSDADESALLVSRWKVPGAL
jgi:hypothetical protein